MRKILPNISSLHRRIDWKMIYSPGKISGFFLKLFFLTFPLQIQTLIYKSELFSGQFNFFGSSFFSLSELFLICSLIFTAIDKIRGHQLSSFFNFRPGYLDLLMVTGWTGMILMNILSVFWADDKLLALLYSFKWLELGALTYLIVSEVIDRKTIIKYLFCGAVLQSMIGLGQYLSQSGLGLWFLGEPRLEAEYLNIARINLGGEKVLRAYGSFAHANLLGGYMFVCLAFLIQSLKKENLHKNLYFLVIFLIALLISFSRSAWLAMSLLVIMSLVEKAFKINWKQLLLAIVLMVFILTVFSLDQVIVARIINFSIQSWDERLIFTNIAGEIIMKNSWWGLGAGNFVLEMTRYYSGVLSPWLLQPAHNFFMMVWAELGIAGLFFWTLILVTTVKMVFASMRRLVNEKKYSAKIFLGLLLGMLPLGLLDHYFYTLWAGQVLLVLVISMIFLDYRRHRQDLIK